MRGRLYSRSHEWVTLDNATATVGISEYAQEQLGDVVYVELPDVGAVLARGDEACVVESVKAASEVYAPVGGEVVAVNKPLVDDPGQVNTAPYGAGWFVRLRIEDPLQLDDLMDEDAYRAFLAELA